MTHETSFHITVAVSPSETQSLDISHDLGMLKAAILYADKVRFCSPKSSLFGSLLQLGNLEDEELMDLALQYLGGSELVQLYRLFRAQGESRIKRYYPKQYAEMRKVKKASKDLAGHMRNLAEEAGIQELIKASQSGRVDVQVFAFEDTDQLAQEYFDIAKNAVLASNTYPLFDDFTGDLVNTAVKEGIIDLSAESLQRAQNVGLSAALLSRLPLFDEASMDEIIDIRKELDRPLVNFRAAIIEFTRDVKNEPWDQAFTLEAERVFLERVKPAVLDLEDACRSNNLLLKWFPNLLTRQTVTDSSLGIVLAALDYLPDIVGAALAGISMVTLATLESVTEWRQKNSEIKGNQLYFYYRAGKKLKAG